MESHIPNLGVSFFIYLKKPNIFVEKNLPNGEFWNEFQRLRYWLPTSLDLHISPNWELILENW